MRLGMNHWPRETAMAAWPRFDPGRLVAEYAHMADLGVELVRTFLRWSDFQPTPDRIDDLMLDRLVRLADIAHDAGLELMPTLLVGNMSGAFWWPDWALSGEPEPSGARQLVFRPGDPTPRPTDRRVGDLFGDPALVAAQARLARAVADRLAGHPALGGWDLANELDQARHPSSDAEGAGWLRTLRNALRDGAPDVPVTYGAHLPSLVSRIGLPISVQAAELDVVSIHAWSIYTPAARWPLDPEIVPFVYALTEALARRPVWMQEFGLPTAPPGEPGQTILDDFLGRPTPQYLASEDEQAAFIDDALRRLHRMGCPAALVWCYADYAPALWTEPPCDRAIRERFFGVVRPDGSEKPVCDVLRRFRSDRDAGRLPTLIPERIVLDVADYERDPEAGFVAQYADWLGRREGGMATGIAPSESAPRR